MPRPRAADRRDVPALVLKSARRILLARGLTGITIRRIAQDIGYTPGTIYLYFRNKDQIIAELRNQGFRMLRQYQERLTTGRVSGPLDRLRRGGRSYITFALENPEFFDLMFNQPVGGSGTAGRRGPRADQEQRERDYSLDAFQSLQEAVRWCQARGYLAGMDPELAAVTLWSTVHGVVSLVHRKRIPQTYEASQELAESIVDFLVDLIQKDTSRVGASGKMTGKDN